MEQFVGDWIAGKIGVLVCYGSIALCCIKEDGKKKTKLWLLYDNKSETLLGRKKSWPQVGTNNSNNLYGEEEEATTIVVVKEEEAKATTTVINNNCKE